MFKFLFKPKLTATLVNGGTQARVKAKHIKSDELLILIYMTINQVAAYLKMDRRQLMNRIIDLDRIIEKDKKRKSKESYKIIQKIKHQK
jgi:hypothetical protein